MEDKSEKVRKESDVEMEYEPWFADVPDYKEQDFKEKTRCKGCKKKFNLISPPGQSFKESETVIQFYQHCCKDCPVYEELGLTTVCDRCMSLFMNQQVKEAHEEECQDIRRKKGLTKEVSSDASSSSASNSKSSDLQTTEDKDSSSENNDDSDSRTSSPKSTNSRSEGTTSKKSLKEMTKLKEKEPSASKEKDKDDSDNDEDSIRKKVEDKKKLLATLTGQSKKTLAERSISLPSIGSSNGSQFHGQSCNPMEEISPNIINNQVTPKTRSGPASKTGRLFMNSLPSVDEPSSSPRPTPSQEQTKTVEASSKLAGKDIEHLKQVLGSNRKKATPSTLKQKRKGRSSGSEEEDRKRKKKMVSQSSEEDSDFVPEVDSDGEQVPDILRKVPPIKSLEKDEYVPYIPSKAKTLKEFDSSISCPGCKENFPCKTFNSEWKRDSLAKPKPIYSAELYYHCLSKCQAYISSGQMKECDNCWHRFLDEDEFKRHTRTDCKKLRYKVKQLKWKIQWMPRQQFFDLLFERKLNSKVNCPVCYTTFRCEKKGSQYLPSLQLYCHWIESCPQFEKEKGLFVTCDECEFKYLNQEDYEKYDPCYKPPTLQPHGKPHYGKDGY